MDKFQKKFLVKNIVIAGGLCLTLVGLAIAGDANNLIWLKLLIAAGVFITHRNAVSINEPRNTKEVLDHLNSDGWILPLIGVLTFSVGAVLLMGPIISAMMSDDIQSLIDSGNAPALTMMLITWKSHALAGGFIVVSMFAAAISSNRAIHDSDSHGVVG